MRSHEIARSGSESAIIDKINLLRTISEIGVLVKLIQNAV
jgi:hypothetical protein